MTGAFVALVTLGFAAIGSAADYDSVTLTGIQPVETTNLALGTLNTHVFTVGGYNLGKVKFSGTLQMVNGTTADFGSENKFRVTYPDGRFKDVSVTTQTTYTGTLAFSGSFFLAYGAVAPFSGGTWEFRYANTFDDNPTGGTPDAQCTITFTLSDEGIPPSPPTATDLGTIATAGEVDPNPALTRTDTHAAGNVKWYKITVPEAVLGPKYLDIDTEGTTAFLASNDTEIGLYDAYGDLVANDDDSATGALSLLSFGLDAPSRAAIGNGLSRNGRNGNLSPGVYYVAVSGFNAAFSNGFTVTTTSAAAGPVVLNFRTNLVASTPMWAMIQAL
jgi:hypothetical protein